MSEYLIGFIAILIFLAVMFALWKGGKLHFGYRDIGVDAEGAPKAAADKAPLEEKSGAGAAMKMTASGKGSAIEHGEQSAPGAAGGQPSMDMSASDGGKIKGARQRVSDGDPKQ